MSILWNMHQFFTYKSSIWPTLELVQNVITWFFYNWSSLGIFTPDKVCSPSFWISMLFTRMIEVSVCRNHLHVVSFLLQMFFSFIMLDNIQFNYNLWFHANHRWICVVHLVYNAIHIFNRNCCSNLFNTALKIHQRTKGPQGIHVNF